LLRHVVSLLSEELVQFLYSTKAASDHLRDQYGVKHSVNYLRKLRSQGKGPGYVLFNAVPHYTADLMAEYVQTNTSAHAYSGVEHLKAGNRTPGLTRRSEASCASSAS
jgi:acetyl esterase/lipase